MNTFPVRAVHGTSDRLRQEIWYLLHFLDLEEPIIMTAIIRKGSDVCELYLDEDTIPNTKHGDVVACGVTADGLAIAIQTEMEK